mmetsp:Transcript_26018/g.56746  ORF Transcript_26018/g.56746 Transcript_26018/m.56746 type:complete len:323 (-) Transcript_26018:1117-2085(-)
MSGQAVQALLAKINAGPTNKDTASVEQAKKPRPRSTSAKQKTVAPSDQPGSTAAADGDVKGSNIKLKLKGSTNGYTLAPKSTAGATTAGPGSGATAAGGVAAGNRTAPITKRAKDIHDFLKANVGTVMTVQDVLTNTGYDLMQDTELMQRVQGNQYIKFEGPSRLRYRPKNERIMNMGTLLNHIRDNPPGTYTEDVSDCYKGVLDDVALLQQQRSIVVIHNPEKAQDALFPLDTMNISVDPQLAEMFQSVDLPLNVSELQEAVQKAGLRSALANQPQKRPLPVNPKDKQKKRRQHRVNMNKVTNQHLPQLFTGEAPKNIDEA